MNKNSLVAGVCVTSAFILAGCSVGGSSESVTVEGEVPIAYVKRSNTVPLNPTDAGEFRAGGDLYIRELSSPSATEYNITGAVTQGQGDVSRPEVSYDGKKIVFAMRCSANTPCSQEAGNTNQDTTWSIWEYDFTHAARLDQGTLRRVMSLNNARLGHDYDPTYLPGGQGFVFTSRRQAKSSSGTSTAPTFPGQPGYVALDEYEREAVANLHTMDAKGGNIQQISFNQSHDRSPTILQNGRVMYSRWDHVGGRNHFSVFTMKPDGTDMFVLYGAHSDGNSRLHPREMQDGRVVTDLMPLSRTQEGGALMILDVQNYSEKNTPANSSMPKNGGQIQATSEPMDFNSRNISINGRVTTPYPLWDGTNRVLVAYTPCQVTKNGQVVACASLSPAELAGLTQNRLQTAIAADPVQNNAPVAYSIQMFDIDTQKWRSVVPAQSGFMFKDPVALMARPEPNTLALASPTTPGATPEMGTLSVRSVYDTDGLGRMGDAVLSAAELAGTPIPKIAPTDHEDTRSQIANLAIMKDPTNPAYLKRPARFVRITKAVPTPSGSTGMREAIGETDFEMQQILGYADVEPDGSFKVDVPADTSIAITVTDARGRAFQSHTNWIQVRPGEQRTCDGCHSPRRGAAINSGSLLDNPVRHPNTNPLFASQVGETMADTRVRHDATARVLQPHIAYTDIWKDPAVSSVAATPCVSLRYTGNTLCDASGNLSSAPDSSNNLTTAVPVNGIINYPDHIQPLWNLRCVSCHDAADVASGSTSLDLSATTSGTGRMTSYQELLVGDPVFDIVNGVPVPRTVIRDGVEVVELGPALVNNRASQGDAVGLARKSRLMEILSGEMLMVRSDSNGNARVIFPTPTSNDHTSILNAAEMRLLAEWIDLGGQYYNDPFNNGVVRTISGLSRTAFDSTIHPILMRTCAGCHQAGGSDPAQPAPAFQNNRFVLTGGAEGDYNVSLSMISDVCNPADSYLLSRPSSVPHPSNAVSQTTAILPTGGADYPVIAAWIQGGCTP